MKVVLADINLKGAERVAGEIITAGGVARAFITGGYYLIDGGYTAV